MTDGHIIRNCSPTLAGIKTGNIFTCPYHTKDDLLRSIRHFNERLGDKGLRMIPLRFSNKKALIYLFRPKYLRKDLSDTSAAFILKQCGYQSENCEQCVAQLIRKLRDQEEFPHEIGLFLGYPPEDVHGFMENKACGSKCTGCWKVYGDENTAQKKFAQYRKCTRIYCEQWSNGKAIERLTVKNSIKQ